MRSGLIFGKVNAGGFMELHLADYLKINGGAFNYDTGRFRIFSMGPEISYKADDFSVSLVGRFLVGSTRDANFAYLGNLLGYGVAQGSIGLLGSINL